jgi:cell wall-associated NlpC family hydrolase
MVNQLLFGEIFRIGETAGPWVRIETEWDSYAGWINTLQCAELVPGEYLRIAGSEPAVVTSVMARVKSDSGAEFPVVKGSSLPGLQDGKFSISGEIYTVTGEYSTVIKKVAVREFPPAAAASLRQGIVDAARGYLHTPYLWGGRSPFGIDCSGLVQIAMKLNGIPVDRDASQQAARGEMVNLLNEALPGDLTFFDNDEGHITHVGIMLDESTVIHCSGTVRIDPIDHFGIFNRSTGQYSHRLRLIRRIIRHEENRDA